MKLFLENFKKHLSFEWYWEKLLYEGRLDERRGIFPNEKIYYGRLIDYLNTKNINNKQPGIYKFQIPENIFSDVDNRFFNKVNITFKIEYGNFGPFVKGTSSYNSILTHFDNNTKRIDTININFDCKIDLFSGLESLIPLICHEFLHAYEDYSRRISGSKSLYDYNSNNKYYDNLVRNSLEGNLRKLRYIIYRLTPSEINASVSEIIGEIEKNKGKLKNEQDIINIVKQSYVFNEYEKIGDYIEDIANITNETEKKEVLKYWCINTNSKIRTYNKMVKHIKWKYVNIMNRFNKNISRNSFRIYLEDIRYSEDYGMIH